MGVLACFVVLLALASSRYSADAQTVRAQPNPVALDQPVTVSGTGFPGAFGTGYVIFAWDDPNHVTEVAAVVDASGNFSVTLGAENDPTLPYPIADNLPYLVAPVDEGTHTLYVHYMGPAPPFTRQIALTLLPRQGWTPPPTLPPTPAPGFAGGLLAFVREPASHARAELVVWNGTQEKTIAAGPAVFPRGARWSPDGARLAFSAIVQTTPHSNVYTLDRHGVLEQLTGHGGWPPQPTGGGPGSIAGSIEHYVSPGLPHPIPDEDYCTGPPPAPPSEIQVELVGTGRSVLATRPPGEQLYTFRFDGIPAGMYSVNASYETEFCQETRVPGRCDISSFTCVANPSEYCGDDEDCDRIIHKPAPVTPNGWTDVIVTPGGTAILPTPLEMKSTFFFASSPSWEDASTVLYALLSGTFESPDDAGGTVWSAAAGTLPLPRYDGRSGGRVSGPDVTAAGNRVILERFNASLAVADPNAIGASFSTVTSPDAWFHMYGGLLVLDASPAWAPDGGHIAFTRIFPQLGPLPFVPDGAIGSLWVKNVATGDEFWVTDPRVTGQGTLAAVFSPIERGGRPAWSPDRRQIAVTYTPDGTRTEVRLLNIADAAVLTVPGGVETSSPAWTAVGSPADFPASPASFFAFPLTSTSMTTTTSTTHASSTTPTSTSTTTHGSTTSSSVSTSVPSSTTSPTTSSTVTTSSSTTSTTSPACVADRDCADEEPCTSDTCVAGACVHTPLAGDARVDCELAQLLAPDICAPDALDPRLAGAIATKVAKARTLLGTAGKVQAARRLRLLAKADKTLKALGQQVNRSARRHRITSDCRGRLTAAVIARRGLLVGLRSG